MITRKNLLAVLVLVLVAMSAVFADGMFVVETDTTYASQLGIQLDADETLVGVPQNAVLQAIGNTDYRVTPGDVFVLTYSDGRNLVTLELQADSDCRVLIQSVGVVEAAGMTYSEFKAHVESLISTYYTYSSPQLQLKSCGMFSVRVSGEVSSAQYVTAWGLTRLSDLAVYASDFASTRSVQVTYSDGSVKTYDLYDALRNGDESDNPILEPGCEVKFLKASKLVSLSGAVQRTGVFQPVDGETVYDLIQNYGGGLLRSADTQSIMVANYTDGAYFAKYVTIDEAKTLVPVYGDEISVVYGNQNLPFVTITGAIASADGDSISTSNSTRYTFTEGETVQQLLKRISTILTSTSDASSAYILRDGEKIQISETDIALVKGDTIVIPFSLRTVTVTGYVKNPGVFEYIPGMTSDYYIALAGGFSESASGRVKVKNSDGSSASGKDVPMDATITAKNNNATTNIAIVASLLAIVTSVLSILNSTHAMTTWTW